jgi:hypothetical protein
MKNKNSCISKKRNYSGFTRELYQKYKYGELIVFLVKKNENNENYIVYFGTTMPSYR